MNKIRAFLKRKSKLIIFLMLFSMAAYGIGRLYFQLTAGFTLSNITADLSASKDYGIKPLTPSNLEAVRQLLNQKFIYLGKGCQSYVFISEDGLAVIKFLKYQRFRPQAYLSFLSFIPAVDKVRLEKVKKKDEKLETLLNSWKIAYEELPEESGLIYVHLNKTDELKVPLRIQDKLGLNHRVNPDEVVFLVQKSAKMLCRTIKEQMANGDSKGAKKLLDDLVSMLLSEYQRGLADNDHALMQNTGVRDSKPLHIDVGQFAMEERFKDPNVYKLELFSKTYKFRIWLSKHYPELETYLQKLLSEIIGPEMREMKPRLKTVDEGA